MEPKTVVIVVMGVTGCGKGTFIQKLCDPGLPNYSVLSQKRASSQLCRIRGVKQDVYLVDTPGFDDTEKDDTEILTQMAKLLSCLYRREPPITGILYLHSLSLDKAKTSQKWQNVRAFRNLCNVRDQQEKVVLGTAMWGKLELDINHWEGLEEIIPTDQILLKLAEEGLLNDDIYKCSDGATMPMLTLAIYIEESTGAESFRIWSGHPDPHTRTDWNLHSTIFISSALMGTGYQWFIGRMKLQNSSTLMLWMTNFVNLWIPKTIQQSLARIPNFAVFGIFALASMVFTVAIITWARKNKAGRWQLLRLLIVGILMCTSISSMVLGMNHYELVLICFPFFTGLAVMFSAILETMTRRTTFSGEGFAPLSV